MMIHLTDVNRAKAWDLLEDVGSQPKEDQLTKTNELFDYVITHFYPPKEEEDDDVDILMDKPILESILNDCSDAIFCAAVVRRGLKDFHLPMLKSKHWKAIAQPLIPLVLRTIPKGKI